MCPATNFKVIHSQIMCEFNWCDGITNRFWDWIIFVPLLVLDTSVCHRIDPAGVSHFKHWQSSRSLMQVKKFYTKLILVRVSPSTDTLTSLTIGSDRKSPGIWLSSCLSRMLLITAVFCTCFFTTRWIDSILCGYTVMLQYDIVSLRQLILCKQSFKCLIYLFIFSRISCWSDPVSVTV